MRKLIKAKYGTVGRLADSISVHRNSISNYLSGRTLLPKTVEQLLHSLGANTLDVFLPVVDRVQLETQQVLSGVIESIVKKHPDSSVMLFGSRARNKGRKYSDIDLGIMKGTPLSVREWSDLRDLVDEQTEDLPYQVDLVDLARADKDFLSSIANDVKFLGGSPKKYLELTGRQGEND